MKQVEKYKGLLDMINGGGANAEGDKFQGGGLLSILANAVATPYGSEDRAEEVAGLLGGTRPAMRPNRPSPSAAPAAIPAGSAPALVQSPLEMFGGQQPAPYSPTVQGSGMTPANNYVPPSDPFSYSGDREAGMAGNNYRLPDDANDFGINPNVGPNPFAGSPGVGGDGRSLDGEILRYAPTGLPEVSPELGFAMPDGSSGYTAAPMQDPRQRFAEELVEMIGPDAAQNYLRTKTGKKLYDSYVKNGYKF
jgi:hypothetical protein